MDVSEDDSERLGFDKSQLPNYQGDAFDCFMCLKVSKNPKQCQKCGRLYCSACLSYYEKTIGMCECIYCQNNIFQELPQQLRTHYNELILNCKCGQQVNLYQYETHDLNCPNKNMPNCKNFQNCKSKQVPWLKEHQTCSSQCILQLQMEEVYYSDEKKQFETVNEFLNQFKKGLYSQPIILQNNNNNQITQQHPSFFQNKQNSFSSALVQQGSGSNMKWGKCGSGIILSNQNQTCTLKEQGYIFKSVLTNVGFNGGRNYWEIIPDPSTENEMKIGVATTNNFDYNTAFCDTDQGFAFYGLGQLRNGSNSNGILYGKSFKKSGVLGVFLDMNKGELHFSIDGINYGKAFANQKLKNGPIYPAIALLHQAGATIRCGLPVPPMFG